jgi:hypothetical protein
MFALKLTIRPGPVCGLRCRPPDAAFPASRMQLRDSRYWRSSSRATIWGEGLLREVHVALIATPRLPFFILSVASRLLPSAETALLRFLVGTRSAHFAPRLFLRGRSALFASRSLLRDAPFAADAFRRIPHRFRASAHRAAEFRGCAPAWIAETNTFRIRTCEKMGRGEGHIVTL